LKNSAPANTEKHAHVALAALKKGEASVGAKLAAQQHMSAKFNKVHSKQAAKERLGQKAQTYVRHRSSLHWSCRVWCSSVESAMLICDCLQIRIGAGQECSGGHQLDAFRVASSGLDAVGRHLVWGCVNQEMAENPFHADSRSHGHQGCAGVC